MSRQTYLLKRVGQGILTLFIVITITFILYRVMPGNPIVAYRAQIIERMLSEGGSVNMERVNRIIRVTTNIDPSEPIHEAYFDYMTQIIVHQDFGESIFRGEPVFDILFKAMPWSVFISVYGLLLGFSTRIVLGALMAYKEGSLFDSGMTTITIFSTSVPYYVVAILALSIFAFQLGWFPTSGRYPGGTTPGFNLPFMLGIVHHASLPILTGFIVGFGGGLAMRGNSIRLLGEDFVRHAQIRGVSTQRITLRYILRNAILPMYTGLMIGISGIFSSGIITERIFSYVGVGWYTFEAFLRQDYPLLMGSFIFYTTLTIIGILIAEFTYGLIDPRADTTDRESF
ncbi:MAG: ABC transporter permease [Halobacteriales archaeon]